MLRAATSSLARRAVLNSSSRQAPCALSQIKTFHATPKREEEAEVKAPAAIKSGLFGTGLSEWYALPIGLTAAIPIVHYDWYVINEETQLAAVFIAFCVAFYTHGGDIVYKSLHEQGEAILKEQNEVEDKVIEALEEKLAYLKDNSNVVEYFEAINAERAQAYERLNAAGAIKPQHDFKAQIERALNMIAQEEASVAEKKKMALLADATASVTEKFIGEKALKKAALDAAIANIKGSSKKGSDPVRDAFIQFFKETGAAAQKTDDGSEEAAQRAAMVAKLNAVAKTEKFLFSFDESGGVKMNA
mmetsp:Transcript_11902/g.14866  ORF Transcript_11902/g.14866 Transcript_11902/m.14866 type:complete len:303 (+) Transcript_11902:141-1049(+)|eukprot:CAMPEP_0172478572 /NCGR_PEP_ID=MMETSP1066-20121228/2587_1 /TAXON_ID=671091 /ORGANISM="Coscinodiscus wailesii, Strain CCMP2513" /LENGTH=302 /DNA_ID=CAMNT_0013238253 /DNA_START=127 /DNA_END=1035 /DNA_ORIENTATION=-